MVVEGGGEEIKRWSQSARLTLLAFFPSLWKINISTPGVDACVYACHPPPSFH